MVFHSANALFVFSGAAEQEQSVCQCLLWGRQRVCCQWEGGAQLSLYRGECGMCCPAALQRPNRSGGNSTFGFKFRLVSTSMSVSFSLQSCKPNKRSVCGSNAKTYRNHCELHRDACLSGLKIQVAHDGHCKGTSCNAPEYIRMIMFSDCFVTFLPWKTFKFDIPSLWFLVCVSCKMKKKA